MPTDSDLNSVIEACMKGSPVATFVSRVDDARVVYLNDAAFRDYEDEVGHPPDLETLDPRSMGFYQDEAERLEIIRRSRAPGGYVRRNDYKVNGIAGAELIATRVVEHDGIDYLVGMLVDLDRVLDVEKALEDALRRLERAQVIAKTGDFVSRMDSSEFDGSKEALRLLGIGGAARTISTNDLFASFHPEDRSRVVRSMQETLAQGYFEVEHRLNPDNFDGEIRWVHTYARVEALNDGERLLRGTVQDITERQKAESERVELQRKMQDTQKLESLGLLAGGIAHDFNNLLAGIMGNADFALMESGLSTEMRDRLQDIIGASRRAADLTRQLLAYSGKGRFIIEMLNLSSLIREITEMLRVSISREHVVRFALDDDIPAVEVDGTQIRQVIMNLMINASEAIEHSGGLITVTTGRQHCDAQYLRSSALADALEEGDYVYFEISDNGVGMDSETLAQLYDPFFSTKFTGRGLGMSAVLGIVRGHRGAIKVYSEPGSGTTFKVFLPVAEGEISAPKPERRIGLPGSGRILIVDDDETVRSFAANVLRRHGYDPVVAEDGQAGLELFRQDPEIRAVILDLTMPRMDGRETFAAMRAHRSSIRTILMSGYNEQDATQDFVGRGLAGFVAKPFLATDLLRALADALSDDD